MSIFNGRPPVTRKTPVAYYVSGVNINYSFKSLEKVATDLGAEIGIGDVIVVDNENKTKRKAMKKTTNGYIIVYVSLLNRNTFFELDTKKGKVIGDERALIDYFQV